MPEYKIAQSSSVTQGLAVIIVGYPHHGAHWATYDMTLLWTSQLNMRFNIPEFDAVRACVC